MEGSVSDCKIQRLSVGPSNNEKNEDENVSNELLDGELVLQHMMDNICQYLNIHDLSHVAQVCK